MKSSFPFMTCLLSATLLFATTAVADDWPQWMGPERDNVWRESGIVKEFPATGLKIAWRVPVAGGYAGPAVAHGRVYVTDFVTEGNVKVGNFDRKVFKGKERVLCLDESTGDVIWDHEYPLTYSVSYPAGPRCTPTVHDGKVYTLGAEGHLLCFDADSGDVIWSKSLTEQYETKAALWGYASHPLIDGQKLICIAGGTGSHTVALDKDSGQELWKSLNAPEQGYAPPSIIEAGGTRQLITLQSNAITSVDPESGEEFWSIPVAFENGLVVMTPISWNDYLFIGGYSGKSLLLKLDSDFPGAEIVWEDKRDHAISPVNVQPILDENIMYGVDHDGNLYGVSMPGGERLWQSPSLIGERPIRTGTAFLFKQADRYWIFNELGELLLARLSPEGYEELGRQKILEPTNAAFGRKVVWCSPAFANKRMYVRNDTECVCVDLSEN